MHHHRRPPPALFPRPFVRRPMMPMMIAHPPPDEEAVGGVAMMMPDSIADDRCDIALAALAVVAAAAADVRCGLLDFRPPPPDDDDDDDAPPPPAGAPRGAVAAPRQNAAGGDAGDDDAGTTFFLYTGLGEGALPPPGVVRVVVDPSVSVIPGGAFADREELREVALPGGLVEIGPEAFRRCVALRSIRVPSSVVRIRRGAFARCESLAEAILADEGDGGGDGDGDDGGAPPPLEICDESFARCLSLRDVALPPRARRIGASAFKCTPLRSLFLHDDIECVGDSSFAFCEFPSLRLPPHVRDVPPRAFRSCRSLFSLEVPPDAVRLGCQALAWCGHLRNVAVPPGAEVDDGVFFGCADLQGLLGPEGKISHALKRRFDGLPVHEALYYRSYRAAGIADDEIGPDDVTCDARDCLGMTQLHILACSTSHDLGVYRRLVRGCPRNLIAEDEWGALPLLYAVWGGAPSEVVQFLLESCMSLYPDHPFDWTKMAGTLLRADAPMDRIRTLADANQSHHPGHPIDWDDLLDKASTPFDRSFDRGELDRFRFLVIRGMSRRVEAIGIKRWRDRMVNMIDSASFCYGKENYDILGNIRTELARFERRYDKIKMVTSELELALWDKKLHEVGQEKTIGSQSGTTFDESEFRVHCRISCGAGIVIRNVLPYLFSPVDAEY